MNILQIETDERVQAMIHYRPNEETDESSLQLTMVTENGTVKRVAVSAFRNLRQNGIRALRLDEEMCIRDRYLIRRMTNLSLKDIGKALGNRDHSTVMHSLEKVEAQMRSDPAFAETVKEITTNINAKQ